MRHAATIDGPAAGRTRTRAPSWISAGGGRSSRRRPCGSGRGRWRDRSSRRGRRPRSARKPMPSACGPWPRGGRPLRRRAGSGRSTSSGRRRRSPRWRRRLALQAGSGGWGDREGTVAAEQPGVLCGGSFHARPFAPGDAIPAHIGVGGGADRIATRWDRSRATVHDRRAARARLRGDLGPRLPACLLRPLRARVPPRRGSTRPASARLRASRPTPPASTSGWRPSSPRRRPRTS